MTRKFNVLLILIAAILATIHTSCKSSFPAAGTQIDCNGQLLRPILNPTQRPVYPGGQQAIFQFLKDNVSLPENYTIQGKVRIAFIVTKDGETCDVRITSKPREYIDKELIRVIEMMDNWVPGSNNGEIIDCYYLLDIKF